MTVSVAVAPDATRARYALDVLLGLLGVTGRDAAGGTEPDIAYGCHGRVRLPAGPQEDWDGARPDVAIAGGVPVLHLPQARVQSASQTSLGFDVLYATYACLHAPWEQTDPADDIGTPLAWGGFLDRHDLLRRPLVHEYAALLGGLLGITPIKEPTLVVTHDVDNNFGHLFGRRESVRLIELEARRLRPIAAARRLARLVLRTTRPAHRDPNDRFEAWSEWHRGWGSRPTYFVASAGLFSAHSSRRDVPYDIRHPEVRQTLLAAVSAGAEIGVHFSLGARSSTTRLRDERLLLEEIVGQPVRSARHHWWALGRPPEPTWRAHTDAGIALDCSLGFNDKPGFRRGICVPFHPFDPERERPLDLLVLPTIAMDAAVAVRDPASAADDLRSLAATVHRVGGALVLDWHVHAANPTAMPGAADALREFVPDALANGFVARTPLELAGRRVVR